MHLQRSAACRVGPPPPRRVPRPPSLPQPTIPVLQYIFAGLYLATQGVVMALYARARSLPPWSLALLCASRRLHSIFLLRLFNDCWAMLAAYVATLALQASGGLAGACRSAPCAALCSPPNRRSRPAHPSAVAQSRRWVAAVLLYSLAVSVKMNVLLMAPGVLAVLIKVRASDWQAGTLAGAAGGDHHR